MLKFEIGKTYSHNFICDSGCWVDWTVLKRTAIAKARGEVS